MSVASIPNEDPSLEHNFRGHKDNITALSFNPNNKQLVSSSSDKSLIIWNLQLNTSRSYNFTGHSDQVLAVEFSPSGHLIASGSKDRTVRLWTPTIRGKCMEFRAHYSPVSAISFSPDGTKLLTGSYDKVIKLWEVNRRFITSFVQHTNWIRCVRFSPTADVIASCADDRTMRLWDLRSGNCINTFPHVKGNCNYLAFHPSGSAVAVAMSNGGIRIYDLKANKLRQNYLLHENTTCLDWHPNGNFLLSSGTDCELRIVDVLEGHPLYTLKTHDKPINAVKFSKTGEFFASAGQDKHVMVWQTNFIEKCPQPKLQDSIKEGTSQSQRSVSVLDP